MSVEDFRVFGDWGGDVHRLWDSAMLEKVCARCELTTPYVIIFRKYGMVLYDHKATHDILLDLIGNTPPDGHTMISVPGKRCKIRSDRAPGIPSFHPFGPRESLHAPIVPEIQVREDTLYEDPN